jgi:hypothetical protein
MRTFIVLFFFISFTVSADPYTPYNQQYTINSNQQYGSTNWYSSPLGMGVAQAGVTLIGGLVNAMSRPDPVQYVQPQTQPIYANQNQQYGQQYGQYGQQNCQMQQLYDQSGNPRTVNVCQ